MEWAGPSRLLSGLAQERLLCGLGLGLAFLNLNWARLGAGPSRLLSGLAQERLLCGLGLGLGLIIISKPIAGP